MLLNIAEKVVEYRFIANPPPFSHYKLLLSYIKHLKQLSLRRKTKQYEQENVYHD